MSAAEYKFAAAADGVCVCNQDKFAALAESGLRWMWLRLRVAASDPAFEQCYRRWLRVAVAVAYWVAE